MEGMPVGDVLNKYPYLRTPAGFFDEVDRIHPSTSSFCHRFKEGFAGVLPNVLKLAEGKSPLAKQYTDARRDALAEDLPEIDLRAGLILLPSIFREKTEHYITMGEGDPATPYPTIQLMDNDWKMAITGRGLSVVKVDGVDVCQGTGLDEAFITAFSMYFAFNIAYPLHFLQKRIVSIVEEGDKPLLLINERLIGPDAFSFVLSSEEIETHTDMWVGVLHHVTGKHEWSRGKCDHGPLDESTRDKELMVPGSAPHEALQQVMFNSCWLKDVAKYLTFRFALSPPVYESRYLLAALDYNHHNHRPDYINQNNDKS
ncbi:hypothetical protein ABVT39_021647 [Epinephelus coioides]